MGGSPAFCPDQPSAGVRPRSKDAMWSFDPRSRCSHSRSSSGLAAVVITAAVLPVLAGASDAAFTCPHRGNLANFFRSQGRAIACPTQPPRVVGHSSMGSLQMAKKKVQKSKSTPKEGVHFVSASTGKADVKTGRPHQSPAMGFPDAPWSCCSTAHLCKKS